MHRYLHQELHCSCITCRITQGLEGCSRKEAATHGKLTSRAFALRSSATLLPGFRFDRVHSSSPAGTRLVAVQAAHDAVERGQEKGLDLAVRLAARIVQVVGVDHAHHVRELVCPAPPVMVPCHCTPRALCRSTRVYAVCRGICYTLGWPCASLCAWSRHTVRST